MEKFFLAYTEFLSIIINWYNSRLLNDFYCVFDFAIYTISRV